MASTRIDIIANNKASAALGKVNRDVKKIETSGKGINDNFKRMKGLVVAVGAALGGIKIAGSFLQTAKQLENLDIQLRFITGSAKEGAKAFDIVTKAASSSAFSLEQMANASPLLLTVADSTEELNDLLSMTGDIATATGLSYEETAGQLQRAMSGGIAAADLFREKGVKSMLGFQEGVQYTAEETARMIKEGFAEGTFAIAGAGEEMAKTFQGQMSMMSDKWFQFQTTVMENGVFPVLKEQLGDLNTFLDNNKEKIDEFAAALGGAVAEGIIKVAEGIEFVAEHSAAFLIAAKGLIALKLATWIYAAATAAFVLGKRLMFVQAMAGPAGWKSIGLGLASMGVSLAVVNNLLGETEEGMDDAFKRTEIEKAIADKVAQLDQLKNSLVEIDKHINSTEIMSLKERYAVFGDADGNIMGDNFEAAVNRDFEQVKSILEQEIADLRTSLSELPPAVVVEDLVDKDTGPAIDEIVTKFKNLGKVTGLYTGHLTKLNNGGQRFATDFMGEATRAAALLPPVISVATGHLSFMKDVAFNVHEEMAKNFIPTITTSTDMLTKLSTEGFSPTAEMAKTFRKVIQVTTDHLSFNLKPAVKSAVEIMGEYKRSWKSSTEFLSHNAIPVMKSAVQIMGEIHDAAKKISDQEKADKAAKIAALKAQEENYDKQLAAFKAGNFSEMDLMFKTDKEKRKFTADAARHALSELAKTNKAAFMINKAFAIKDAIVNTSQGVVKALSMGPIGIPLAFLIGAMGVAQIATIASQSYSGRRFGGPVSNDESYIVGENGPEMFTPGATGRITANEGMVGGGQTINFNITATDAKSVDELIVQRKPMIINMIRQATQERGNRPAF